MGRKSLSKKRKRITSRTNKWLSELLVGLQYVDLTQLTMDDMASIAGKSKSTIYEYFESKEEILRAACETRTVVLLESIMKISRQELTTVDLYRQLIEIFAEGTAGISLSFLQTIKQHYPQAWAVIDEFTDRFVELLKDHYQQGMEEGTYNAVSVELLSTIDRLFVIQVITNSSIFSDEKYTVSELVRDYLNIRLMGLLKR
jgi:AcrR family transcriptional regulator